MDKSLFEYDLWMYCVGKKTCQLGDLSQYVTKPPGTAADHVCFLPEAQIFLQVGCVVPDENIDNNVRTGLVIACSAVFISLFIVNYLDYIKKVQINNYVEWDVKTITAGDFTIEFDIKPEFFEDYLSKLEADWVEKCARNGRIFMSKVQGFQAWIQNEM